MSESLRGHLGRWQEGLGPSARALWGGALRAGVAAALLLLLAGGSLALGEDPSPWAVAVVSGWIVVLVFAWGALDLRWGEGRPWATTCACTLVGQLGWIVGLCQWEYLQAVGEGQVAGWSAALEGLRTFERWPSMLLVGQSFGAAVLCRQGRVPQAAAWLNAGLLFVFAWIPLYVVCSAEEAAQRALGAAAREDRPSSAGGPDPGPG